MRIFNFDYKNDLKRVALERDRIFVPSKVIDDAEKSDEDALFDPADDEAPTPAPIAKQASLAKQTSISKQATIKETAKPMVSPKPVKRSRMQKDSSDEENSQGLAEFPEELPENFGFAKFGGGVKL